MRLGAAVRNPCKALPTKRLVCFCAFGKSYAGSPRIIRDAHSREDDGRGECASSNQPSTFLRANGTARCTLASRVNLAARISIHQQDLADGFTKRYGVHMLVHYEQFDTMPEAIAREKQLKKFRRAAKLELIESSNPQWRDLTSEVQAWRS